MQHLASRQSLDATTDALLSTAANLDDYGLQTLGDELRSVGELFDNELALRRALSDNSVPTEKKTTLLGNLLRGKVSDATSRVMEKVVAADWSTGKDLTEALGRLSRTAMFLRAERAGELDDVEDQIFRFGRIIEANPSLSSTLDDVNGNADARRAVINRLLDGKAHPLTVEMLSTLASDTHGRSFSYGVDQLVEEAAQRKDKAVAVVTSPVELTSEQSGRLNAALAKIYRRPIIVHVQVDPSIQGGLVVRVGDEVIDGSVAGRIAEVKSRLG